jgi:hypothetical protein
MPPRVWLAVLLVGGCAGCGSDRSPPVSQPNATGSQVPRTLGRGPAFRPAALGEAAKRGAPVRGLRCAARPRYRYGVHLELFAKRHVVQVPAGIGIAPPWVKEGAYVRSGRCWYPLHTVEPTGVIEVQAGPPPTLGELFDLWGYPLSERRLLSFRAKGVRAFVGGRPWRGDPRSIPLRPHAQIVLEVGGFVPPHPAYRFPPGL